ncbi:lysophospholipid acyltransferase family protein [Muricoccus aerilatus]|uniref:lysophospholipid acyltransferase family protein n=1 Tax=Muricoccus aerilatus TaxID=452982 RepID=UPI000A00CC18|nr:lysophospholipid acyltransferase family protein [Roseomonas aerilata]
MLKRLTRHPRFLSLAARLLGLYVAFAFRTTRWTLAADAATEALRGGLAEGPVILAFWHERITLGPGLWVTMRGRIPALAPKHPQVLVSRHRDGVFIGGVVARFGLETIHGSSDKGGSSKGGSAALRTMLRVLRGRGVVAITPDGPRGPRRVAATGVGQLAALSGAPVFTYGAATTRCIRLRSWDKAVFPLPFGRGLMVLMAPFTVPPEAAEAGRAAVEALLTEACDAADAWAEAVRRGTGAEAALAAARALAGRAPPVFAPPLPAGTDLLPDEARPA